MTRANLKFIYWFAFYDPGSPSVRYRALYPLEYFRKNHNVNYFLVFPGYTPEAIIRFLVAYLSALFFRKKDSLIVIQRVNSNFIYGRLLKFLVRMRNSATVYDLDKADYLEYSNRSMSHFIEHCSGVSLGSKEMIAHLRNRNANIIFTPSPVPELDVVKRQRNELFTIGWIGGYDWGHRESLTMLFFPALENLPFRFQLVLLGVVNKTDIDDLQERFGNHGNIVLKIPRDINWLDEIEIQNRIAEFDIGIATLFDTPLLRSKSGIKAKQYLNNGVPVLSSDVAENNTVVIDGVNGYLCRSPGDFRQRLIEVGQMSEDEYMRMSRNARESVKNFNMEAYHRQFMEYYSKTVAG